MRYCGTINLSHLRGVQQNISVYSMQFIVFSLGLLLSLYIHVIWACILQLKGTEPHASSLLNAATYIWCVPDGLRGYFDTASCCVVRYCGENSTYDTARGLMYRDAQRVHVCCVAADVIERTPPHCPLVGLLTLETTPEKRDDHLIAPPA